MLVPSENGNGAVTAHEPEVAEPHRLNGGPHAVNRLLTFRPETAAPLPKEAEPDDRPALATFCFDEPDAATTRFVANLAGPLAARGVAVHVFTRKPFEAGAPGVVPHVLGDGDDGSLLDRVQEFTHRACNAFLRQFQKAAAPVTLGPNRTVRIPPTKWSRTPGSRETRAASVPAATTAAPSVLRS